MTSTSEDDPEENEIFITHYDKNGNETATFVGEQPNTKTKYEYSSQGKVQKSVKTRADGTELSVSVYSYEADGSYKISTTDKTFGMVDYEWFNTSGLKIRTQSPDGARRIYSYDAKGNLMGIRTEKADEGATLVDISFTYNNKNQLIREVNTGEYSWDNKYEYNTKGLITKAIKVSGGEDYKMKTVTVYSYEFY